MNSLVKDEILTLDSREVAGMMEMEHSEILKKLEGTKRPDGTVKQVGIIPTMAKGKIPVSDYFIPSTYKDASGKENKCYLFTKMGCEFIANKFTGEKGILFTAKYTKRFNQMEQTLKQPIDSYMIQDPIERAKAWIKEQEQKQTLEFANRQKDQLIGELRPKADYMDKILQNTGLVTITQIAKDYGISGEKMNSLLHRLGVQYKQSGQWLLYTKYQDKGYTHSATVDITHNDGRPDIKMNTKWTQKGRLFLYNLLKGNGVLPVIERKEEKVS
jgi:phage antirepressor YoqD-like protein